MPDNTINIVPAQLTHLHALKSWFPDQKTAYDWCGPGLRYPFTHETFMEDIHWESMPAYSLLNENKELIGFGQYYKKAGRCHLARLVISPSYRSLGIGYNFISMLMGVGMQELGVRECSLFVIRSNTKALKCYHALQFVKAEYPPGHERYNDIDFMVWKSDPSKTIEK